jgi:phosphoglycolate phosphatase-like HAD superfamily hydrolase
VLWDIDQTLIAGGGVGREAYAAAFQQATGARLERPWQFNGHTEQAAATEVLRSHGFSPDNGLLDRFLALLVNELERRKGDLAERGQALPGAVEALAAVGELAHQSVLTGNLYPVAVLKLSLFGMEKYVDPRIGAYGGDAYERHDLPPFAVNRARHVLGTPVTDLVIVGDTVRDVETALTAGATAVAVATGRTTAEDLAAAGAHFVLPDLADTTEVLKAVAAR